MRRKVTISRDAAIDLETARLWLRQDGAGRKAAERLSQIRHSIRDLRLAPVRWPHGRHDGVREVSIGGYRILYEVDPDTGDTVTAGDIVILRVFGPGQDRGTPS